MSLLICLHFINVVLQYCISDINFIYKSISVLQIILVKNFFCQFISYNCSLHILYFKQLYTLISTCETDLQTLLVISDFFSEYFYFSVKFIMLLFLLGFYFNSFPYSKKYINFKDFCLVIYCIFQCTVYHTETV